MLLDPDFSAESWTTISASRHSHRGGRKRQSVNGIGDIVVHSRFLLDNLAAAYWSSSVTLGMQGTLR